MLASPALPPIRLRRASLPANASGRRVHSSPRLDLQLSLAPDTLVPRGDSLESQSQGTTPIARAFPTTVGESPERPSRELARQDVRQASVLVEFADFAVPFEPPTSTTPTALSFETAGSSRDSLPKLPFPISQAHTLPRHVSVDLIDLRTPVPSPTSSPRHPLFEPASEERRSPSPCVASTDMAAPPPQEETGQVEILSDTSEESEEEDPDTHPLYTLLSSSTQSPLLDAWQAATLILVPSRRTLPNLLPLTPQGMSPLVVASNVPGFELIRGSKGVDGVPLEKGGRAGKSADKLRQEQLAMFVMLHAFHPDSQRGDVWRSIGTSEDPPGFIQLRLEPARGLVHVEWVEIVASTTLSADGNAPGPSLSPLPTSPKSPTFPLPARTLKSHLSRPLQIVSESTIYRRRNKKPTDAVPIPDPVAKPAPKLPFRAPKWLRRGSPAQVAAAPLAKEKEPMLERVRLYSVEGEVVLNWPGSTTRQRHADRNDNRSPTPTGRQTPTLYQHSRTTETDRNLGRTGSLASSRSGRSNHGRTGVGAGIRGISASRDFLVDLTFLALPPSDALGVDAAVYDSPFPAALATLRSLVKHFESTFLWINGFDTYTVQRVRRGILEKVWQQLARDLQHDQLGDEDSARLLQLLENVVLGFLHIKLYVSSISPLHAVEDGWMNSILVTYRLRSGMEPADLGVDLELPGKALDRAVKAMSRLSADYVVADSISPELLLHLSADMVPTSPDFTALLTTLTEARTPLSCISVIREAIEEIVAAVEAAKPGARVAPDDLIPLLAWVTVKSGAEDLESLLYHVKTFRLGDSLASELDWSFVTFSVALAYLRSDPLEVFGERGQAAALMTRPAVTSSRRASELPSFRPRNTSLHLGLSAAGEQTRSSSLSPRLTRGQKNLGSQHRMQVRPGGSGAIAPVRERRLSWQPIQPAEELVDGGERAASSSAVGAMLPPASTSIKHLRRQSLGVLPSSLPDGRVSPSLCENAIPEGRRTPDLLGRKGSFDSSHRRAGSTTSTFDLQIKPRIVLARQSSSSGKPSTSLSSRRLGPSRSNSSLAASDGGRSDWRDARGSPTLSDGEGGLSRSADGQTWWEWGRSRLNSVGSMDGELAHFRTTNQQDLSDRSSILLNRTQSLPIDRADSSSARLAAILSARSNTTQSRPLSILSVSSVSSVDPSDLSVASPVTSTLASSAGSLQPLPRIRKQSSTRRRELPTSSTPSLPLPGKVDALQVQVSFPSGFFDDR